MTTSQFESIFRTMIRWGLYPFSWVIVLTGIYLVWNDIYPNQSAWGAVVGTLFVTYLVIERLAPYENRWSMTWGSFLADLRFMILNGFILAAVSAGLALFAISLSAVSSGPARDWPFWFQMLSIFLVFEAFNYSIHRAMHEAKGAFGRFLWLTHAAHHLPPRLYILMHAVGHPINAIITQVVAIILPIWLMGYDQNVVTFFLMINSMHGLISHFNVDVRMGWMNYVFVGPELHRYHHSANVDEAKNYGATLTLYDQLFGTFVYRPGAAPEELGVDEKEGLPAYERTLEVIKLPFIR